MKKGYRKKLEQTFLKFSLQTFPKQNPTMRKKYFFFSNKTENIKYFRTIPNIKRVAYKR